MQDLLSYFTEHGSTRLLQRTEFVILYNPWGGYYNLHIKVKTIKDGNEFQLLIKRYNEEKENNNGKKL